MSPSERPTWFNPHGPPPDGHRDGFRDGPDAKFRWNEITKFDFEAQEYYGWHGMRLCETDKKLMEELDVGNYLKRDKPYFCAEATEEELDALGKQCAKW